MRSLILGAILLALSGQSLGQTVAVTTEPPPTVTVSAAPLTGPAPLTTTLTWSSTNADSCRRGNDVLPTSGSIQITNINNDTQYVVTCTGGKNYSDVTWVPPTQMITGVNPDGSCIVAPIPVTGSDSLAGFRLVYNTDLAAMNLPPASTTCSTGTANTPIGTVVNIMDPAARSYRVPDLTNGTYYYVLSALNQAGSSSAYAGPVTNTINRTSVSASVTVDVTAFSTTATAVYNVVKKNNGFVMVQVGTVPLNTVCDKTQYVNGYNAVPVSAVTSWSGTIRPIVVVAQCSER
jgi:hypothetical protein